MKSKLYTQQFIEQNPETWEKLLSESPYCLTISRDIMFGKHLIMFKYDQISSDFNYPLVQECRGLILDEDTLDPISVPFYKFFNYGESHAAKISWDNCWVGEKIDGSICKVSKISENDILISTNGTIDAFKAPLAEQLGCKATNFGELFLEALTNQGYSKEQFISFLEYNKTYIFELTSPWNKIVVQWPKTKLWFLGVRDNCTFQESYFSENTLNQYFDTPKIYPLNSIDDCLKAVETFGPDKEGFVICDKNFNRIKLKSIIYVSLHKMHNNGVLSYERGLDIVRTNELDEVLVYFPEFKEHLNLIKGKYDAFVLHITELEQKIKSWIVDNGYFEHQHMLESGGIFRKTFATWLIKETAYPAFGFALIDKKINSAKEWLENIPTNKLAKFLEI